MRKLTVAAALLLVLALATPSNAGIDEGDWEVALAGNLNFADFHTAYGADVALGYFVTPEIQVGGWIGYMRDDYDGKVEFKGHRVGKFEATTTYWDIAAFGAYYFETDGEWVPYVGGFLGWDYGKFDDGSDTFKKKGLKLGVLLGVKYFVSERATIFFEYRLTWNDKDEWELDSDSDVTVEDDSLTHLIQVGISVLF